MELLPRKKVIVEDRPWRWSWNRSEDPIVWVVSDKETWGGTSVCRRGLCGPWMGEWSWLQVVGMEVLWVGPVFTWADVGEEMRGGWGFGALGICTVEDLFVAPIFYVFALMHQRRPPVYFPLSLTTRSTQNSRLTKLRSLTNLTSIEC